MHKTLIVLCTSAVCRAVHVKLVSALSTDAFLLSLRYFISKIGKPRIIYSDNGANFKGASNDFSKIFLEKLIRFSDVKQIFWQFSSFSSRWWSGWLERVIRVIKKLLWRTLGKAFVILEELQSNLCDFECIIHFCFSTYQSKNPEDLILLRPNTLFTAKL